MDIKIGDRASCKKIASLDETKKFAELSGDFNPIHLNKTYAEKSEFKGCITHGLFCLGMVSYVIGMKLPGEGSIFLNEELRYRHPVYMGDEIETTVEVRNIDDKGRITMDVKCTNQNEKIVLEGTTILRMIEIEEENAV